MENKILFVHDGPLFVRKEKIEFYGNQINDNLIDRYLYLGESISFLMRSQVISDDELIEYSKIEHPNFNFISIPNFKSIRSLHNKGRAKDIIIDAVREHEIIILRFPSAAAVIAFKEAKKLNKPVLVEFVACVFDALWNYDWRGKIIAKYKFRQYQKLMRDTSHTIYVTNSFLQSRYPSPGKSIGCSDVE